jgi:hypothetical protein
MRTKTIISSMEVTYNHNESSTDKNTPKALTGGSGPKWFDHA